MTYLNKEDEREYQRQHYLRNKPLYQQRAKISRKKTREERRKFVQDIKQDTPCMDCGNTYHYCAMDFDHTSNDKIKTIARLIVDGSMKKLKEEILKCDLICANCHRLRIFARLVK